MTPYKRREQTLNEERTSKVTFCPYEDEVMDFLMTQKHKETPAGFFFVDVSDQDEENIKKSEKKRTEMKRTGSQNFFKRNLPAHSERQTNLF